MEADAVTVVIEVEVTIGAKKIMSLIRIISYEVFLSSSLLTIYILHERELIYHSKLRS